MTRPRALILHGGWAGHHPRETADLACSLFAEFDVVLSDDLARSLRDDVLASFDLLVPIWTLGELPEVEEAAFVGAVSSGLGVVAWHGAASAFLRSRPYKAVLGGQFVGHPGGDRVPYDVRFRRDLLTEGLADFRVTSEQYYLLVDPAVTVLATTSIVGADMPWLAGVEMPVAWRRQWGEGKVFYCSLGHSEDLLAHPTFAQLAARAASWARRTPPERPRAR
jgi:type 1 glutamine amidotransferase